jgi:hypothetical protein
MMLLLLVSFGLGVPENEIEKAVGFEFIKYKMETEVKHWHESNGVENEIEFKVNRSGEIIQDNPLDLLLGVDSVRVEMGLMGMDPLCGCEGCYSKNEVQFFGLKKKMIKIEYGACGGNFEAARFQKGKKRYVIYFSKAQAEKLDSVFKSVAKKGLKEIHDHYFNE